MFAHLHSNRGFALLMVGAVLLSVVHWFRQETKSPLEALPDHSFFSLLGPWKVRTGDDALYSKEIEVPKPIPPGLWAESLPFWYRKEFEIPAGVVRSGPLALSLGSIKGNHQVFWNGKYLGGGVGNSLGLYSIPDSFLEGARHVLEVRVEPFKTMFPGIVHFQPVGIGPRGPLLAQWDHYYFESGAKQIFFFSFKLLLGILFAYFFLLMPKKRDYLWFSWMALWGAFAAIAGSRHTFFYEDYYLRQSLVYFAQVLCFGAIPGLVAAYLRRHDRMGEISRIYGYSLAIIAFASPLWKHAGADRVALYREVFSWLPLFATLPPILWLGFSSQKIHRVLAHRRWKMQGFGLILLMGALLWSQKSQSFFQFQRFVYPEVLDLLLLAVSALLLGSDFRDSTKRAHKAGQSLPRWFRPFLSARVETATVEVRLMVLAVDTVGYTQRLESLSQSRRNALHDRIRNALVIPLREFGAEKISDGGDGALFAWELDQGKEAQALELVLECARRIHREGDLEFRMGVAAGFVRGEYSHGDYSFLGEPLNQAARLESMAAPGQILVSEDLTEGYGLEFFGALVEAAVKGVVYRGRSPGEAA